MTVSKSNTAYITGNLYCTKEGSYIFDSVEEINEAYGPHTFIEHFPRSLPNYVVYYPENIEREYFTAKISKKELIMVLGEAIVTSKSTGHKFYKILYGGKVKYTTQKSLLHKIICRNQLTDGMRAQQ